MPVTKFTNLDFDQIKTSIKDYLRSNSKFTDFDFEGSNFSILIDTLAYNTYINAFNSNMVVNESFLDSATVRQNAVSLAGNIGYTPRSRTSSEAQVSITAFLGDPLPKMASLKAGLVCTGDTADTSFTYAITENIVGNMGTTMVNGISKPSVTFDNINIHQGTYLTKQFEYDGSLDQKFILNNANIDTSKIRVYVKHAGESGLGVLYTLATNIININSSSNVYFIREIQDEKYELKFGDGMFGKKLGTDTTKNDGNIITVQYLVTDGEDGNGASRFTFSGNIVNENGVSVNVESITLDTNQSSQNGSDIESIESVKYYSPLTYSSQNRAVTPRDYEAIIKKVYPNTESVSIIGGEELDPPEFGTVNISIKPKNGSFVSDFSKEKILSKLKQYSVSGINQKLIDLKVLYVEIDSNVYYNNSFISTPDTLKSHIIESLSTYSKSVTLNKFGGRFKYSKVLQVIDDTDNAITSNITKVRIRRDLRVSLNQSAQYELCFGNQFHVDAKGFNIKSTGFNILGELSTVYLTDVPNEDLKTGVLSVVKKSTTSSDFIVVNSSAGTVDYEKGEIILNTIHITSTIKPNNIVEIQAFPESNDVLGLKDLYLSFSVPESTINMVRDVIASGDEVSGVKFAKDFYTSSYSNGKMTRE